MSAIRAAVTPPKPGSLDPLKELEALMQRKDLTALEARRAQILMKNYGTGVPRQQNLTTHIEPLAMASEPPMSCAPDISSGSTDTLSSGHKSEIGSDAPTVGMELEMRTAISRIPAPMRLHPQTDKFVPMVDIRPGGLKSATASADRGSSPPTARSVFLGSLAASYPEARPAFCVSNAGDESTQTNGARPTDPPPGIEILSAVRNADGNYEGYIAVDGTCMNAIGVCVGYLNDVERTAGSPKGEYLGCVTEPRHGEAIIERPDGTQLAVLELGRAQLKTLSGSTVAEFRMNGEVIANLGNQVCSFDTLSFHDQSTMALYLSFINPTLLTKAAQTQMSTNQQILVTSEVVAASSVVSSPCLTIASRDRPGTDTISEDTHLPLSVKYRCLADFKPNAPWQLAVKEGEELRVLQDYDDGWATCLDTSGRRGMLPSSYLKKQSTPASKHDSPRVKFSASLGPHESPAPNSRSSSVHESATRLLQEAVPNVSSLRLHTASGLALEPQLGCTSTANQSQALVGELKVAIACFDADASQEWQVSLKLDEHCHLVKDHGDGWALITKVGGAQGMVPITFLSPLSRDVCSSNSKPPVLPRQGTHKVLHQFSAEDPSWQVQVEMDDEVDVCERFDDGWSSIIHLKSGRSGLVPSGFLQPIDDTAN